MFNFLFKIMFNFLNRITPKNNRQIVFCGYPDFDDMLRGICYQSCDYNLIVLKNKKKTIVPKWLNDFDVKIVEKHSYLGFFYLITSRYIIYTHGLFDGFSLLNSDKQLVVNVWHGMPLKNIAKLDGAKNYPLAHKVISTSPLFKKIMSDAFDIPLSNSIVSGLPRNNILLYKINNNTIINKIKKYSKVYVWLPTYRASKEGDIRCDSNITSIFGIEDIDVCRFNEKLIENNQVVFLKPHPMAIYDNIDGKYSNINIINEEWLNLNNCSLYELLSLSNVLITDYSSVYIDYLLLKRPIIFSISDISEYSRRRGFTFNYEVNDFPGYIINNQEQLFDLLNKDLNYVDDISLYHSEVMFNLGCILKD